MRATRVRGGRELAQRPQEEPEGEAKPLLIFIMVAEKPNGEL